MTITHEADENLPEEFYSIKRELDDIKAELAFIKEHIVKSADVIDKVGKEVMPTINGLMESPMLKALVGKPKRK